MPRGRRSSYTRDNRGRFASSPGGGGPKRSTPATRRAAMRAGNRLNRDNSGRISGIGRDGATVRGGRLKTAKGNQRATQLASMKAPGFRSGVIAKGGRGVSGSVARSLQAAKKARLAAKAGAAKPAAPSAPAKPAPTKPTRTTSKVVAPGRIRKVRGPGRRIPGTIAKPKGWKPGTLAGRKGKSTTRPSIPGFTPKDFERRARRAFYDVKNTKVRDRALQLYKRFMDTDKTPAQLQKELTTGRRYSTVKNKPKTPRKRLSQGEREHRDTLALAKYLFR